MRLPLWLLLTPFIAACALPDQPSTPDQTTLPFFGSGFPAAGDPCRRLGESAETVDYLDHTADLVACPETLPTLDAFVADTGAIEVFRQDGFIGYSIPKGT